MDPLVVSIFQIAVLICSVVIHEVSHGFAARSLGDDTAERLGRLTLNPFSHLDLFGSIILPLITSMLGFTIGYAKPVPYNPDNLSDKRFGPAKVAVAGPLANITLAIAVGLVMRFALPFVPGTAFELLGYIVWINIILAFFNLMPIPPLDGHWLLMAVLPARFNQFKIALYRMQWLLLAVLMLFIFPLIAPVLQNLFQLLTGARLF